MSRHTARTLTPEDLHEGATIYTATTSARIDGSGGDAYVSAYRILKIGARVKFAYIASDGKPIDGFSLQDAGHVCTHYDATPGAALSECAYKLATELDKLRARIRAVSQHPDATPPAPVTPEPEPAPQGAQPFEPVTIAELFDDAPIATISDDLQRATWKDRRPDHKCRRCGYMRSCADCRSRARAPRSRF